MYTLKLRSLYFGRFFFSSFLADVWLLEMAFIGDLPFGLFCERAIVLKCKRKIKRKILVGMELKWSTKCDAEFFLSFDFFSRYRATYNNMRSIVRSFELCFMHASLCPTTNSKIARQDRSCLFVHSCVSCNADYDGARFWRENCASHRKMPNIYWNWTDFFFMENDIYALFTCNLLILFSFEHSMANHRYWF